MSAGMDANGMADAIETDVAIIGAGPVGLFAVFQCGMLRMRCVVLDALDALGGQCTALYPEKPIYDIPAHPMIDGSGLVAQLERQAAPFTPRYLLGRRVERPERQAEMFRLTTQRGEVVLARAVIIAAGAGAFGPNRPPLDGIDGYETSGAVRYAVTRRDELAGQRVVIAGGGDSAVDWALALRDIADVTIVHRRDRFRAAPESAARLQAAVDSGAITLATPYQLHALEGDGARLEAVVVATLRGETRRIPADRLLAFFGLSTALGPLAEWGLALDQRQIAVAPATGETSWPGVFAIGDIASYPGKLKLILQGFSEAAMAAHAIHPLVFPGEALHFEYSTTRGVPAAA
jgi:thioredoxin reductase (NADPH)